jgi:hypothetical protein
VLSGCTSPQPPLARRQTRHRAIPHAVTTPRTRAASARSLVRTGRSAGGPGRQAAAQPACRLATHDRPPRFTGCNPGPVAGPVLCWRFNRFPSCLKKNRNCFKIPKFVETCRNVQKLQNKFCTNPLDPIFIVGLTKLTFAW